MVSWKEMGELEAVERKRPAAIYGTARNAWHSPTHNELSKDQLRCYNQDFLR